MKPSGSSARLVIALSAAAALAVFPFYTRLAGGASPSLRPSQLAGHSGAVDLAGLVLGPVRGDPASTRAEHWRLFSLRAEVVLLNFWASWCIPCKVTVGAAIKLAPIARGRIELGPSRVPSGFRPRVTGTNTSNGDASVP